MKFVFLNIALTIICWVSIMSYIKKHSVHPKYGNYKHFDSEGKACQPWDDCKQ